MMPRGLFFGRFSWKEVDAFFPALITWLLVRLPVREATLEAGLHRV
jgi:hypothetical protein